MYCCRVPEHAVEVNGHLYVRLGDYRYDVLPPSDCERRHYYAPAPFYHFLDLPRKLHLALAVRGHCSAVRAVSCLEYQGLASCVVRGRPLEELCSLVFHVTGIKHVVQAFADV